MARVLSVTDRPTANMLPLVAPAAQAVVTAAAAKSQSEHVVTSGFNPTQGMAMQPLDGGNGHHQQGHGEQDAHASNPHEHQDLDALAAKIARSILVKMQREKERRGQYG